MDKPTINLDDLKLESTPEKRRAAALESIEYFEANQRQKYERLTNSFRMPSFLPSQGYKEMLIDVQVEAQRRIEAEKQKNVITWSGEPEPLEPLTEEQKQTYNNRTVWTWVDAIYILQGYKPVYQLSTEQVRSHFPQQVHDFTRSIQLGTIGKEIIEAGEKTFIDSPANWQAFWQGISKQADPVATVGVGSKTKKPIKEKELKQWLRETWISEGRLGGTAFFTSLKKYVNTKGSPILEHYTAGKCAGFRWETSTTTRGEMRKKTILNIVAAFKNTP